jgi:hypothetical protein
MDYNIVKNRLVFCGLPQNQSISVLKTDRFSVKTCQDPVTGGVGGNITSDD